MKNGCLTNLNVGNMELSMNEKRIEIEIGILKLILTIVSAIFVPFTAWLYNNFDLTIERIALAILDFSLFLTIFTILLYLFNLLKKL